MGREGDVLLVIGLLLIFTTDTCVQGEGKCYIPIIKTFICTLYVSVFGIVNIE